MPAAPVPASLHPLLAQPNPAVLASVRADGTPHTVATWYAWEDGGVLLSMDHTRLRIRFLGRNPAVALTVLDRDDWYRHVSLIGEVTGMGPDEGLRVIDRLARHYTGAPYPDRDSARVIARIRVDRWHGWDATGAIGTHADIRG
ncbi:MAG TPA: PPOX class F420-dependent oxidoreductase [Miltoncostaeaceae bacterium]|nr:PPOX class F420-dependent oxidoreductase [Miltoncostaeaceae bacterium]